ncbi:HAD hydrolase-like protein [Shigella flexneri]
MHHILQKISFKNISFLNNYFIHFLNFLLLRHQRQNQAITLSSSYFSTCEKTMYERYAGLIFDMDGTILDTEPTHRKAWREVLGHDGLQYDIQAMIALNGSPTCVLLRQLLS